MEQKLVTLRAGQPDPAAVRHVTEQLAATKVEFFKTLTEIRAREPDYEKVLAVRPVNFAAIQQSIPPDACLVELFPTAEKLYFFVVSRDAFHIRTVNASRAQLDALVGALRQQVIRFSRRAAIGAEWSWRDDGSKLFKTEVEPLRQILVGLGNILLAPIEEDLKGKEVVAWIPTGSLLYLPLQALAQPRADGGLEFLIERKQVAVLVKASDVDALARPVKPFGAGLAAFGNPDGTLMGAQVEARDVGALFASTQVFLHEDATKQRLLSLPPGNGYLHLATHGILDSHDANSSYLVMAGPEERGKLTVPEIFGLTLATTRMVTLSACETALAEGTPGSEITTLAEAFSIAGAPTVVASLWSVGDVSTHDLMMAFYTRLRQGMNCGRALQQAQVELLRNPRYAHPFFWAPFEIIGDWR